MAQGSAASFELNIGFRVRLSSHSQYLGRTLCGILLRRIARSEPSHTDFISQSFSGKVSFHSAGGMETPHICRPMEEAVRRRITESALTHNSAVSQSFQNFEHSSIILIPFVNIDHPVVSNVWRMLQSSVPPSTACVFILGDMRIQHHHRGCFITKAMFYPSSSMRSLLARLTCQNSQEIRADIPWSSVVESMFRTALLY